MEKTKRPKMAKDRRPCRHRPKIKRARQHHQIASQEKKGHTTQKAKKGEKGKKGQKGHKRQERQNKKKQKMGRHLDSGRPGKGQSCRSHANGGRFGQITQPTYIQTSRPSVVDNPLSKLCIKFPWATLHLPTTAQHRTLQTRDTRAKPTPPPPNRTTQYSPTNSCLSCTRKAGLVCQFQLGPCFYRVPIKPNSL